MIFGDEKLTPLRSVPRCALGYGSGRLTGGYLASCLRHFAQIAFATLIYMQSINGAWAKELQIPASR
jgi:hypothetical protein